MTSTIKRPILIYCCFCLVTAKDNDVDAIYIKTSDFKHFTFIKVKIPLVH